MAYKGEAGGRIIKLLFKNGAGVPQFMFFNHSLGLYRLFAPSERGFEKISIDRHKGYLLKR